MAIVAAVGVAAASTLGGDRELASRIEAAMAQAVLEANAEGISVEATDTIKARMNAARIAVLEEVRFER